jgi:hypothetical protein
MTANYFVDGQLAIFSMTHQDLVTIETVSGTVTFKIISWIYDIKELLSLYFEYILGR